MNLMEVLLNVSQVVSVIFQTLPYVDVNAVYPDVMSFVNVRSINAAKRRADEI
jgi:hypothetical protein